MTLRQGSGAANALPTDATSRFDRLRIITVLALLATCLIAWGCKTNPISGRRQVYLGPENQEVQLGATAYQEILSKEQPSKNQKYVETVQRVGKRIAAIADLEYFSNGEREPFSWEFKVVDSGQKNAFCLPGGKVAVYEGIIPICESEAGLAVVMSHEVAHALLRHGGERMRHQQVKQVGGKVVDLAGRWWMKEGYDESQEIVMSAYGVVSEYGAVLPYSRSHESEADLVGLRLMAKAGYDPSEAPRFWERFATVKGGEEKMEFLSTHPSDARRAADLRMNLPEALNLYSQASEQHGLGDRIATVESTNISIPLAGASRLR